MSRIAARLLTACILSCAATVAAASELDARMRAVESIRGLQFRGPVQAVTIGREELPTRLREQLTRSLPYSVSEFVEILEALLLIEPAGNEAFDTLIDLYESQVLAYYDPPSQTFYMLSEPPAAMNDLPGGIGGEMAQEGVVIHELMHALQDQHFDIGQRDLDLRKDTDAAMAYHAVLEGEATLVMLAHLLAQSGADFDTLIREPVFDSLLTSQATADLMTGDAPRYFAESMKFPYLEGLKFVLAAYRRGGWKELDRIHADPPRSTREVLHPEEYFAREFRAPAFLARPAASGHLLTVEHLGEFHWSFLLGPANARGWINDRVTIVQDSRCEPTVLVEAKWESEEAARRFHTAYMTLLDGRGIGFLSRVDGRDVRLAYGSDRKTMEQFLR
ncbi:MAG TPA: hypothetical protein VF057_01550 [Thermoanaerobaculia bacterium]